MSDSSKSPGKPKPSGASTEALRSEHVAYLDARAVPVDLAVQAGLRSVDGAEAAKLLGRSNQLPSGGLWVPYGTPDGYGRLRVDEPDRCGGARWLAPAGKPVPIYIPPPAKVAVMDSKQTLFITEGPIKALALVAAGYAAVGLGGTATTLDSNHRLNGSWQGIPLEGRSVAVIYDAGRTSNPRVARDEARLTMALEAAGAKVTVAALPLGPDGSDQGPDDYISRQGKAQFRKMVKGARPADPVQVVENLVSLADPARSKAAAALLGDLTFIVSSLVRGPAAEARVKQALRKCGVSPGDWWTAREDARRRLREADVGEADPKDVLLRPEYEVVAGCICRRETELGSDGTRRTRFAALTNFEATIETEVLADDGVEQVRRFTVSGRTEGRRLPAVILEPSDLADPTWPIRKWGAGPRVFPRRNAGAELQDAIVCLSSPERRSVFSQLGWREIGGQMVFLHADGAIGAADVAVAVEGTLAGYRLPAVPENPADALALSLTILDLGPREILMPVYLSAYRAPLQHALFMPVMVWVYGPSGTMKTTIVTLVLSHHGQWDYTRAPASWLDTVNAIEMRLFFAKDVPLLIDDFAPTSVDPKDEMRRKVGPVVRAVGNRSSRGRLRADLSGRPDRPPRALAIATGEDLPTAESGVARILPVRFGKDSIDLAKLTALQAQQDRLPHAMAGYINWLRPWIGTLSTRLRNRVEYYRDRFRKVGSHLRHPLGAAHLMLAAESLSQYGREIGVFSAEGAAAFEREAEDALASLGAEQAAASREADPTILFLETLGTLLAQGKVKLADRPEDQLDTAGRADYIGWRDGDHALLLASAAYAAVASVLVHAGRGLPVQPRTLWSRLRERGVLLEGDGERPDPKKIVGGQRRRVLVLALAALGLADERPDGGGGGAAPDPLGPGNPLGRDLGRQNAAGSDGLGGAAPTAPEISPQNYAYTAPSPSLGDRGEGGGAVPLSPPEELGPLGRLGRQGSAGPTDGASAPGASTVPADHSPVLVTRADDLPAVADSISHAGIVGLDVETTGLDPRRDCVRLVQLALPTGEVYVIDLFATGDLGPVADALRSIEVVGHHLAFDFSFLRQQLGVEPRAAWDTMLAAQVLNAGLPRPDGYFGLREVLQRHLDIDLDKTQQKSDWGAELSAKQISYAARDAAVLLPLREKLIAALDAEGLLPTVAIENAALPAVVDIRLNGLRVDKDRWQALVAETAAEAATLAAEMKTRLGIVNPDSPTEVTEALVKTGVPLPRTSGGRLSSKKEILAGLAAAFPVVDLVRRYQAARTFPRGLGKNVLDQLTGPGADGRVRCDVRQVLDAGRMSCAKPALQGVPKRDTRVRPCLVAEQECLLVRADYGQIELRVLAEITRDPVLIEHLQPGRDAHKMLAARILGTTEDKITREQRQKGKAGNFGLAFGQSPKGFMEYASAVYGVALSPAEAQRIWETYRQTYRRVAAWQDRTRQNPPKITRTVGGRARRFPKPWYSAQLNAVVQGTAADAMKIALALLHGRLGPLGARLLLAVHDEVVVEAPAGVAEQVKDLVVATMKDAMERFVKVVPVEVEADVRSSWAKGEA